MNYINLLKLWLLFFCMNVFSQTLHFETERSEMFKINKFNITIYPIDTNDAFLIGKPSQVIMFENKWYILDYLSKKIFVYYKNGKFFSVINGLGDGPKKYSNVSYFTINPTTKNIELIDPYTSRIHVYDVKGNFINSKKIPYFFSNFLYLELDTIVIDRSYQKGNRDKDFNLLLTNKNFEIQKRLSEIQKQPPSALSFASRFPLKKINSQIFWIKTYDPTLYEISSKGIKNEINLEYKNIWPEEEFAFNDKLTDLNLIYHTFQKKYMYFFDIYPFKNYYISKYMYQKTPYISVLDKKTKNSITYNCSNMPKNFNDFKGYTDDAVILMMNPSDIIKLNITLTKEQLKLIESYEYEPNPWIVTLKKK